MKTPIYSFGQKLVDPHGFIGKVDSIFADYEAVVNCRLVPRVWFELQTLTPSSKDQIFYGIVGLDGNGAVVVGENDALADPGK